MSSRRAIGAPIGVALGTLIGWLTAGSTGVVGSALMALLSILGGICGLAFSLIYQLEPGAEVGVKCRWKRDGLAAYLGAPGVTHVLYRRPRGGRKAEGVAGTAGL